MEEQVLATILELAQRRNPALTAVSKDQTITGALGLDSLDVAQLVAVLEAKVGFDPFTTSAISGVKTVGDLCNVYAAAAPGRAKR